MFDLDISNFLIDAGLELMDAILLKSYELMCVVFDPQLVKRLFKWLEFPAHSNNFCLSDLQVQTL